MNPRHRLRGRARIAAVRSRGAEGRSSGIRVHALPNGGPTSRAAFAVSGRTGAVQRNRTRRRLRAAATEVLEDRPGFDVLVSARPGAPEPPFARLIEALRLAMSQAASRAAR